MLHCWHRPALLGKTDGFLTTWGVTLSVKVCFIRRSMNNNVKAIAYSGERKAKKTYEKTKKIVIAIDSL